jgi:uncharacterized membrane protein YraQ (UPF0718 family)
MLDFLVRLAVDFWATLGEMSPYLLFGFLVAGLLSVLISQRMVERHLGGSGLGPVLKASLFGIPLPLCSCGVIPVSMSLHQHGASKASTISFLLSTPQTGADSILVTYSLLGPVFAVFRPVAALVTGLVGGGLVNAFGRETRPERRPGPESSTGGCCHAGKDEKPGASCCSGGNEGPQGPERPQGLGGPAGRCPAELARKLLEGLRYGFVSLPRDIGKPLLLGLAIAAVISALVPDNFFAERLGRGLPAMLVMMAVGIPFYVCASASVPMAAAMILKGLSPGAALVFLMTGPATNAAGLATIWKTLGRRVTLLYLLAVAGCALAGGFLLDSILYGIYVDPAAHIHNAGPGLLQHVSAVVLLGLLGYTLWSRPRSRASQSASASAALSMEEPLDA